MQIVETECTKSSNLDLELMINNTRKCFDNIKKIKSQETNALRLVSEKHIQITISTCMYFQNIEKKDVSRDILVLSMSANHLLTRSKTNAENFMNYYLVIFEKNKITLIFIKKILLVFTTCQYLCL